MALTYKRELLVQLFRNLKWTNQKSNEAQYRTSLRLQRKPNQVSTPYSIFETVRGTKDWEKLQRLSHVVKFSVVLRAKPAVGTNEDFF